MDRFFDLISQEPVARFAVSILCIAIAAFAISLILITIIAFFQGRGISIWPPKIGEKSQRLSLEVRSETPKLTWEEYLNSVNILAEQLTREAYVGGFHPDLIIGISRGGAVVSDLLSRRLNNVPLIILWAVRDYATDPRKVCYAPPENPYNRLDLTQIVKEEKIKNILLVDDFCKMGGSLDGALRFIHDQLKTLPDVIRGKITIKTAVIAKEATFDTMRIIKPDYCIHDNITYLPYGRG